MPFNSAAEEISQWAERCRNWASGARTREQQLMLRSLEMLLSQAAVEAQDTEALPHPQTAQKSS